MKHFFALTLVMLLLCGLWGCAGQKAPEDVSSDRESVSAPSESRTETRPETEPSEEAQKEPKPTEAEPTEARTEPQTEAQPTEARTEPQAQNEPETKTVSLALPFMKTEDFFSFQPEDGAGSGSLSMEIPADWTEDAGLFYCPGEGGVRKVLEPVCLLRDMDDARWEKLARFDVTATYGETEYLSVDTGVDANGRDHILLLGKSWPEGDGVIVVWYPCFCFLREADGTVAVLTYYLLDPEDASAKAELRAILDSIRLE